MAPTGPIFVHSLFRCASTFFFQRFRALGEHFTCYQEPFNESLEALNRNARQVRLLASPHGSPLRHPALDRPYFYEFWQRRAQLKGLYRRAFAYREYFVGATLPAAQQRWISALIAHAHGRSVLQFCRSSGRAAAMRDAFGGVHLHLWREPRAQWWSYKVAEYFDSVSQHIYAAPALPVALAQLAHEAPGRRDAGGGLTPLHNYALFYGLWLHAWLRLNEMADLSISVDRIALVPAENRACAQRVAELVGETIDLTGVRTSGMAFAPEELRFYEAVEQRVGELFVRTGESSAARVRSAEHAAVDVRRAHAQCEHDASAERNLRQTVLTMMERSAQQRGGRRSALSARARAEASTLPLLRLLYRFWEARATPDGPRRPTDALLSLPAALTEATRDGYHQE